MTSRFMGRSIGRRASLGLAAMGAALTAQPAAAQFFWSPPDFSTPPLTDAEAATALGLPGATAAEVKAGLVWNLRAALNDAARTSPFEPPLLSSSHRPEERCVGQEGVRACKTL